MKKTIIISILLFQSFVFGQFKGQENVPLDIKSGILNQSPISSLFNFIDPSKFSMSHSFGISYSSFGSNGFALGTYTNSLSYEFSEKFNFELRTSFVNSPYSTFGDSFSKSINGIYIDRARLNYSPSKDFQMSIQFSNSPFAYYNRYNYYSYSPFSSFWDED